MANLYTLKLAMMEVVRADTGGGGLVVMTGKTVPLKRDKAPDELDPPEMSMMAVDAEETAGVPAGWNVQMQFDVAAPMGSEGLEERMADRLEEVLTQPALLAEGVDVRLGRWRRRDLSELADGCRRTMLENRMVMTR